MSTFRIIALFIIGALFFSPVLLPGQLIYIKKYKPVADSLSAVYGIPSALILGVAIFESGEGTSANAKLLNNHFGIVGKNSLRKKRGSKNRYKQYSNATYSYIHFVLHLTQRKFYRRLKDNMNYRLWVDAMAKDHYSTMPAVWKKRVLAVIKKNKLTSN